VVSRTPRVSGRVTAKFASLPPWYLVHNQMFVAVGADPRVRVDALDTTSMPYRIDIHVPDRAQAAALASLLTAHYDFGGTAVDVRILDTLNDQVEPVELGTARDVVVAFETAFGSNPLFLSAFETPSLLSRPGGVGVVFKKALLQYPTGDIGELYGNTNAAAAEVFGNLLVRKHGDIAVRLGTQPTSTTAPGTAGGIGSRPGRLR
jgi:hypothetical protein